jgi:hypothetical protein
LTLDEALGVAARYRTDHGSFEGFDAASARQLDSSLLWDDGVPGKEAMFDSALAVRIVTSTDERVEMVLVQAPTTYCVRDTPDVAPTYGVARSGRPRSRALLALETCGAQPWTSELLRPFPIDRFCDDSPEVVMCRAVQKLFRDVIASPTGLD